MAKERDKTKMPPTNFIARAVNPKKLKINCPSTAKTIIARPAVIQARRAIFFIAAESTLAVDEAKTTEALTGFNTENKEASTPIK
jgi:hypothetical protein